MNIIKHAIVASFLLGSLASCGSSADSAVGFVESGKALMDEGKTGKARLEFKNAIQIDPRMAEAFYQLALIDEKEKKWKAMFSNLTTVEQLDPTHYDAIVKLGQIHLLAGNMDLGLEKANSVLSFDKTKVMAWVLRATIEMKKQNLGSAMNDAEQALLLDGKNIEALSVKALILNQQGKEDQALALLDEALELEVEQTSLLTIKLSILESQKKYAAMEKVYNELLVLHPKDNWIPTALAKLLNFQGNYDEAKQVLQNFITENPEDENVKLLLVSLVKTKSLDEAIQLLDGYIQQSEENYPLQFAKVNLLIESNNESEAVKELQKIVLADPEGNDGRNALAVLAGIDFNKGSFEAADEKVSKILEKESENENALLLKARIELINENIDNAISNLRIILRNNPESDKALTLLAQAYVNSDSAELAEDSFRQALKVNPSNAIAALFVANTLMKNGKLTESEEVLETALKTTENKDALLQALAQVKIMKKDWSGTELVVGELQGGKKNSAALTHYLNGQIAQGQSQFVEAIAAYKAALTESPNMVRALQALAYCYAQLEQKPAFIEYLHSYIAGNPKNVIGYSALANIFIQEGKIDTAIDTFNKGLDIAPKWQGGYGALASIYSSQNNSEKVLETYQRGLKNNEGSNYLLLQLASFHEKSAEFDKAKAIYEDILMKDPNVEPAINNLASLLTDQYRSEANLKKALALTKRFESATQPYYLDTYAWTNGLLGNYDKAQSVLERVVSLAPNVAIFSYHLGVVYQKQDKTLAAEKYLNKAKSLAEEQSDEALLKDIAGALTQ